MIKIGIIGTDGGAESGHSVAVCKMFNFGNIGARITYVYGENREETEAVAKAAEIENIADSYEDMIGHVDGVMIMPRNGNTHLKYALPFIENGIPTFVDKPFTCTAEDTDTLAEAIKRHGTIVCGGSCVKYDDGVLEIKEIAESCGEIMSGYIAFPTQLNSPYGFQFYSQHMIEVMLTVFGREVEDFDVSVTDGKLVAIAKYKSFPVILNYAANYQGNNIGIHPAEGDSVMKPITCAGKAEYQCKRFADAIKSGEGDDLEHFIRTVELCNVLEERYKEALERL